MIDPLGNLKRTNYCGELRGADDGREVLLMGWVHGRRDLGNLIFIDLRDRTGIVQIAFNKELQPAAHAKASEARSEYVVAVRGKVVKRQKANPELGTGEIEIVAIGVAHFEHVEDAAISGGRCDDGQRGNAAAVSLFGFAAAASGAEFGAASQDYFRDSQGDGRAWLSGN